MSVSGLKGLVASSISVRGQTSSISTGQRVEEAARVQVNKRTLTEAHEDLAALLEVLTDLQAQLSRPRGGSGGGGDSASVLQAAPVVEGDAEVMGVASAASAGAPEEDRAEAQALGFRRWPGLRGGFWRRRILRPMPGRIPPPTPGPTPAPGPGARVGGPTPSPADPPPVEEPPPPGVDPGDGWEWVEGPAPEPPVDDPAVGGPGNGGGGGGANPAPPGLGGLVPPGLGGGGPGSGGEGGGANPAPPGLGGLVPPGLGGPNPGNGGGPPLVPPGLLKKGIGAYTKQKGPKMSKAKVQAHLKEARANLKELMAKLDLKGLGGAGGLAEAWRASGGGGEDLEEVLPLEDIEELAGLFAEGGAAIDTLRTGSGKQMLAGIISNLTEARAGMEERLGSLGVRVDRWA